MARPTLCCTFSWKSGALAVLILCATWHLFAPFAKRNHKVCSNCFPPSTAKLPTLATPFNIIADSHSVLQLFHRTRGLLAHDAYDKQDEYRQHGAGIARVLQCSARVANASRHLFARIPITFNDILSELDMMRNTAHELVVQSEHRNVQTAVHLFHSLDLMITRVSNLLENERDAWALLQSDARMLMKIANVMRENVAVFASGNEQLRALRHSNLLRPYELTKRDKMTAELSAVAGVAILTLAASTVFPVIAVPLGGALSIIVAIRIRARSNRIDAQRADIAAVHKRVESSLTEIAYSLPHLAFNSRDALHCARDVGGALTLALRSVKQADVARLDALQQMSTLAPALTELSRHLAHAADEVHSAHEIALKRIHQRQDGPVETPQPTCSPRPLLVVKMGSTPTSLLWSMASDYKTVLLDAGSGAVTAAVGVLSKSTTHANSAKLIAQSGVRILSSEARKVSPRLKKALSSDQWASTISLVRQTQEKVTQLSKSSTHAKRAKLIAQGGVRILSSEARKVSPRLKKALSSDQWASAISLVRQTQEKVTQLSKSSTHAKRAKLIAQGGVRILSSEARKMSPLLKKALSRDQWTTSISLVQQAQEKVKQFRRDQRSFAACSKLIRLGRTVFSTLSEMQKGALTLWNKFEPYRAEVGDFIDEATHRPYDE